MGITSMKKKNERRVEIGQHLVVDPEVCHGRMTFKGTRVWVEAVLADIEKGESVDDVLRNWPELSREAVEEALHLAGELLLQNSRVLAGAT